LNLNAAGLGSPDTDCQQALVYTVGILFLAVGAGGLLAVFGGITDRLIPLFAVGAFLSFTLSQAGMAQHWRRSGAGHGDRARLAINGLGALATGAALVVILVAKFTEGAWLTVVVIPLTVMLLRAVRRYYSNVESHVLPEGLREVRLAEHRPPIVLIPLERWDRLASRAVHAAVRLSPDVVALHLEELGGPDAEDEEARLRQDWARQVEAPARRAGVPVPRLIVEPSPYRSLLAPILRTVEALREEEGGRPVVVVLSEFVGGRWWEVLMHTQRTKQLRRQLLRHGGPGLAVLVLPWQLEAPETEAVLAEEEPVPAK
jgi:hypothetical protein